ncbi:OmpP1/FadL family transporter [Roseivirga sp. BDSF3-8]|uniref:OmpP1/FadL family transporter n=1 Tax=Roseivirga sp. BDSF3-8 TaxID=3241598 RepID=UPI003531C908
MRKKLLTLMAASLLASSAWASGFQVLLQGNRSTAMGNLGVAVSPDVSSVFFNPGALAMMDQTGGAMIGLNLIQSNSAFYDSQTENSIYTAETENPMGTPFHLYAAHGNDKFKVGLGVYTPYGSNVDWEADWKGQFLLDQIELRAIFVQPTASYRITENISIGGGPVYAFGSVNLQRDLPFNNAEGQGSIELDGDASGWGYNVGVFFTLSEKVNLGFSYRSKVDMEVDDGDVIYTNVPALASPLFPADNSFSASLPLPSNTNIGITYMPTEQWSIGFEANMVGWGAYEALAFDFEKEGADGEGLQDSSSPRNYEDSFVFHLGAEYRLSDVVALRGGGYYDQTPVQLGYMTPETPDANRVGLTAGVGLTFGNLVLDASFLYINGEERTQTTQDALDAGTLNPDAGTQDVLPGTYKLNAFIPGLSASYKF